MRCNKCDREVMYVESTLLKKPIKCGIPCVAFVMPKAQHVILEDGTMVAVPAGTVLSGHVLHDPLCPGRYRAPASHFQAKEPDDDGG